MANMTYERAIPRFDVVDTQVHVGPGGIDETLRAMDALGVASVLIDEFWLSHMATGDFQPVEHVGEQCVRPLCPTAELASRLHPDRFSYVRRVAFNDPEAEALVRVTAADPGCKAFRIEPGMSPVLAELVEQGAYERVISAVEESGKPLAVYLPDRPATIRAIAKAHPDLTVIVDHMGLYSNNDRASFQSPYQDLTRDEALELFDEVCSLAELPNVVLKFSHYSENLEICAFPGEGLRPVLRSAIDAFGTDRVIWASDFSVNQRGETWAELLFSIVANDLLTVNERAAVLGGNARRIFRW